MPDTRLVGRWPICWGCGQHIEPRTGWRICAACLLRALKERRDYGYG